MWPAEGVKKRYVVGERGAIRWNALGRLWKGYVDDRYTYQIVKAIDGKVILYHQEPDVSVYLSAYRTVATAKKAAEKHLAASRSVASA